MKFDFTEGEWYLSKDSKNVMDKNKLTIALCPPEKHKEYKANARLISCAPEMLIVLIEFIKKEINKKCKDCMGLFSNCNKQLNCYKINLDDIKNYLLLIEKATGKKWEDIINDR